MSIEYKISSLKKFQNISNKLRKIQSSIELEFNGKELNNPTEYKGKQIKEPNKKIGLSRVALPDRFKSYLNKNKLLIEPKSMIYQKNMNTESEIEDFSFHRSNPQSERGKEDFNSHRVSISIMTEKPLKPLEISNTPSKINLLPKSFSSISNNRIKNTQSNFSSSQKKVPQNFYDYRSAVYPRYFQVGSCLSPSSFIVPYQVLVPTYNYFGIYSENNSYKDFHSLRDCKKREGVMQKNVIAKQSKKVEKVEKEETTNNTQGKTKRKNSINDSSKNEKKVKTKPSTKELNSIKNNENNQDSLKQIDNSIEMICPIQKSVYINLSNSTNNLSLSEIFNRLPQSKKLTKSIRNSQPHFLTPKAKIDLKNVPKQFSKYKRNLYKNCQKSHCVIPHPITPIKHNKNCIQVDLKQEGQLNTKQLKREELVKRLSSGKKVEISKKSMISLTTKNYNKLPEVMQKKMQIEKKKEIIDRIQKIKQSCKKYCKIKLKSS